MFRLPTSGDVLWAAYHPITQLTLTVNPKKLGTATVSNITTVTAGSRTNLTITYVVDEIEGTADSDGYGIIEILTADEVGLILCRRWFLTR